MGPFEARSPTPFALPGRRNTPWTPLASLPPGEGSGSFLRGPASWGEGRPSLQLGREFPSALRESRVCMCKCVHVCVQCVHMCAFVSVCMCMSVHMCACTCVRMYYVCMHVHACVWVCTCGYARMYACVCMHLCVCAYMLEPQGQIAILEHLAPCEICGLSPTSLLRHFFWRQGREAKVTFWHKS